VHVCAFLNTFCAVFRPHWLFFLLCFVWLSYFLVVFPHFDWFLPVFRQAKDTKRHLLPIFWVTEWTGDVKTVYFSEPVTGLPKPVFTGYRKAYCERDNCHRSLSACYQSIACCFTAAVALSAYQMHERRKTKDSGVSKRWGQREQMFLPPWADNYRRHWVGPQCKNGRFSLPLQCI